MTNVDFTPRLLLELPFEYETKVRTSSDGTVSITQDDGVTGPHIVALSKSQAEQVYLALKEFVEGC